MFHLTRGDSDSITTGVDIFARAANAFAYQPHGGLKAETLGNGVVHSFTYNNTQTGLLNNQTVVRGPTTLLDLSYDYANASGKRKGQLTKITNNLNHNKDRGYVYGELKKVTDPTNVTINYNYDSAGRIDRVTGENNLYGGVSQYASNLAYRAWSGIKGLTYGNNYTLSVAYNSRLQGTQFEVAGQPSQYGPSTVMKTSYQYYANGSLRYAQDQLDERFDRACGYDHRGMLLGAYTGSEARDYINGTSNSTQTVPYRQSYQYDAFGNMTSRDASFWSHSDSFSATYTNHRRTGFFYDADGRLTQDDDLQYQHDAAGRIVAVFDPEANKWLTYGRDGDGQLDHRLHGRDK